jgi:Fe2+ or Zn2+ uptake regulation protein
MKRRLSRVSAPAPDIDLRQALAAAGWRLTRQREVVHAYLRSVEFHPTAEQVYAAVRRHIPRISLATVYKALEALVEAGLATKLPDASGPARFDHRCDRHYHLRCLKSGQIRDLQVPFDPDLLDKLDPQLVERLEQQGFQVSGHHLEILGYFEGQPV